MLKIPRLQCHIFDLLDSCTAKLTENEARDLCGCSRGTWKRWRNGQDMPLHALRLLEIHLTGKPPEMGQEWAGFSFAQGKLWTPANQGYNPGDILTIPILEAQARELRLVMDKSTVIQHRLF